MLFKKYNKFVNYCYIIYNTARLNQLLLGLKSLG